MDSCLGSLSPGFVVSPTWLCAINLRVCDTGGQRNLSKLVGYFLFFMREPSEKWRECNKIGIHLVLMCYIVLFDCETS